VTERAGRFESMGNEVQPGTCVVLFDGVCNLCNGWVRFVLHRDPHMRFRIASLQSKFGADVLQRHGLSVDYLGSILLLEDGELFAKSDAVLRILRKLRWPWPLLSGFVVVPRGVRDLVYDWVAGNRYRWFGKRDACMLPRPEDAARFLS
jgi:predicted DCC family thiol-disulfide oxidoreductase YuxK